MDDYFSGLIRPHIDEMKLEEEDWGERTNTRKEKNNDTVTVLTDEAEAETNTASSVDNLIMEEPPEVQTTAEKSATTPSTSSSSSDETEIPEGPSTLQEFRIPMINYERDYPTQPLVGVIGREFDEPWVVSATLQELARGASIDGEPTGHPKIKFLPYTIRRSVLIKGSFQSKDITRHDIICMCYNASEARIMLTGTDGFYSMLLKHVEASLGSNRVAFLVTHYVPPGKDSDSPEKTQGQLVAPELRERLKVQKDLELYLEDDQVMSWYDKPQKCHMTKLLAIANTEPNPSGYMHCAIL